MRKSLRASVCGLVSAALVIVATGCKSSNSKKEPVPTPEVRLSAQVTANQVKAVSQEFFRNRGYVETESRHVYEFIFDKPEPNGKGRALRVRLRLYKQADGSWLLVGAPMGVESWRGDLESERVLSQGASQIHGFLVEIKNRVEAAR